jgi:ribulose-5-phosphate 4-epimerase/fuculose-1-phosphate aldolase
MNAILKPTAKPGVHPDEWAARLELAACYRIFAMLGWTEMIYNHITLRLPDSVTQGHKQFLINPFGLHYSEITASNLLKIDLQGNKLDDSPWAVNPAGFTVHGAIHQNLAEAHCVMHTHTTAGLAVACSQLGLAQNNFYSAQLHGLVAYHDFEGITVHADEAPRLLKNMGDKPDAAAGIRALVDAAARLRSAGGAGRARARHRGAGTRGAPDRPGFVSVGRALRCRPGRVRRVEAPGRSPGRQLQELAGESRNLRSWRDRRLDRHQTGALWLRRERGRARRDAGNAPDARSAAAGRGRRVVGRGALQHRAGRVRPALCWISW